ncbi:MAG: adenylate/guanylate cyclase domain-containing protein, partial [Pseudomonadota bacterium]
ALRALRFDPRFVLAAGLIAALGWTGMLWYALEATGDRAAPITRNFIEYINGTPILIGAEVEKILMLLAMTAVLAIAIARARRMFLTAMRDRSASQEMGRFLSQGLAEKIADADETFRAGEVVERNAGVLMIDIRGFTPFAVRHGPERLVEMLTRFHKLSVPIIERHGGVIDKFLGDGVMATFGALGPSETAARDALAAMREVLDEAEHWIADEGFADLLDANAAVSAGPLVFTTLGHAERLESPVLGPPVTLAAKLEKHNTALGTRGLVDMTTFLAALEQGLEHPGSYNPERASEIAGVDEPLDLMGYGRSTRGVGIPANERVGAF